MSKKNNNDLPTEDSQPEHKSDTKIYLWVALAACVLGAVLLALTFVPAVGAYGTISAFICELAALSFINVQRKKNPLPACKPIEIVCYLIGIAVIAILIGAAIYSANQA